jgi:hypothetical protein
MIKSKRTIGHIQDYITANKVLVRKPGGKRPFVRTRCRWRDNIKMYNRHTGLVKAHWMNLAHDSDIGRLL